MMKLRGKMPMLTSMVYVQALLLIRSALIGRALGPEQFGLALTFILIQQFLDMSSDVGVNKYILSANAGHRKLPQSILHSIALSRSFVIAGLLLLIAYPIFHYIDDRFDFIPFMVLAASTLVTGLVHTDNIREQRVQVFRSQSISSALGETAALAFAIVYLQFQTDYLVALYAMLVRAIVATATTHLLARRAYRLRYDRIAAAPIWIYAMPLLVNGPLLFFSGQADRLMVSALLGPKELGVYSAALLLIMSPSSIYSRFLGTVYLPKLSRERQKGASIIWRQFTTVMLASAAFIVAGFVALGQVVLTVIFGPNFAMAFDVTALVGTIQALRFLRVWPLTLSLAAGRTDILLKASAVRLVTLPSAWLSFTLTETLSGLLVGLLIGEAISLLSAIALDRHAQKPR